MHLDLCAVGAERLGRDGERDGLGERVGGGARLRLRRRGSVAKGEEADVFHGGQNRQSKRESDQSTSSTDLSITQQRMNLSIFIQHHCGLHPVPKTPSLV